MATVNLASVHLAMHSVEYWAKLHLLALKESCQASEALLDQRTIESGLRRGGSNHEETDMSDLENCDKTISQQQA